MEKITLIASDFDDLNGWDYKGDWGNSITPEQYFDNQDCPIARALKRTGIEVTYVCGGHYESGKDTPSIRGSSMEVSRCAKELLAGAEEAYIQIIN